MKTLTITSILAMSFIFLTMNSNADGIDTTAANASPLAFHRNYDFAFKLDPTQIKKDAETVDLSDLYNADLKVSTSKKDFQLPFAFKLDPKQIEDETQQVDQTELNAK